MAKTTKKTAEKAEKVEKKAPKAVKKEEQYFLVAGFGNVLATSQEEADKKVAELMAKGF